MVHRRQGAVRSVPGVSAPQSAVLHQLGRASFAIQRPGENAGRHEAAASSIDDGCLLKRAEGQLVQIALHEAARIASIFFVSKQRIFDFFFLLLWGAPALEIETSGDAVIELYCSFSRRPRRRRRPLRDV